MIYEVTGSGESVRVEGDNWLVALGASLEFFGLDPSGLSRLAIDMKPGGDVRVKDPLTGRAFVLSPVPDEAPAAPFRLRLGAMQTALSGLPPEETAELELDPPDQQADEAPPPLIMPVSIFAPPPELAPLEDDDEDTISPAGEVDAPEPPPLPELPASALSMVTEEVPEDDEVPGAEPLPREETASRAGHVRAPAEVEDDRPEDLHEDLFFRSMDISAAETIDKGCQAALSILRGLIPSESGAVLYASINDTTLRFVSAFGPAARQVLAREIPVDTGAAGFCHLRGVGLIINDTDSDARHDTAVDRATGYHTRRLLSAGIRDQSGNSFGCIQLLNAPGTFRDWHLEATQVIASELAEFIARRQ